MSELVEGIATVTGVIREVREARDLRSSSPPKGSGDTLARSLVFTRLNGRGR